MDKTDKLLDMQSIELKETRKKPRKAVHMSRVNMPF